MVHPADGTAWVEQMSHCTFSIFKICADGKPFLYIKTTLVSLMLSHPDVVAMNECTLMKCKAMVVEM